MGDDPGDLVEFCFHFRVEYFVAQQSRESFGLVDREGGNVHRCNKRMGAWVAEETKIGADSPLQRFFAACTLPGCFFAMMADDLM